MKKLFMGVLAALMMVSAAGCSHPVAADVVRSDNAYNTSPQVTESDLQQLLAGNGEFAFKLYQQLEKGEGNAFYSPYSISLMMAMTYAGARGKTSSEMAQAMDFNLSPETLHLAFNYLQVELAKRVAPDAPFALDVVNDLWGQKDFQFLDTFLDVLAENYDAGLRVLDFKEDPEGARQMINDYIYDKTNQLIKDLIPAGSINTHTRLVLTNAIYFKADWKYKFNKLDTGNGDFQLLDGTKVSAVMMNQRHVFNYAAGDGWEAIELPYAGDSAVMDIILPSTTGYNEFEANLTTAALDQIIAAMHPVDLQFRLPKFKYGSEFSLKQALSSLGMTSAFDPLAADFSGITTAEALFIQDAVHKAFVSVDEDGTEAAAAGAVVMGTTSMPQSMTVDHPFIFVIRDVPTGTILFMGRVMNPAA